jgi:hypothetical protein
MHVHLARFNRERFRPLLPSDWHPDALDTSLPLLRAELAFVESERQAVSAWAQEAPEDASAFVAWFERLRETGPGQSDPLFSWLASEADAASMAWFLTQEVAGEAGFDDLVALTQLQLPMRAKLEMARNYWDEMGRGHSGGMHGPMLADLAQALALPTKTLPIVWPAQALGNLMVALASHRHYAFQSLGALGVIELTAPGRAAQVNAGLKRLGVAADVRRYYAIHATLDVKHSQAWNAEILYPLIAEVPRRACAIAEGALMRLFAGARCFAHYRAAMGLDVATQNENNCATIM